MQIFSISAGFTDSVGAPLSPIGRQDFAGQLQRARARYEAEAASFREPLSDELVDLCLIVERILTRPGGSVLIAGRPGMGRRAAVSLVAHAHAIRPVTLRTSAAYALKHFANDLKLAIQARHF